MSYHVAIDIGASSGRLILAEVKDKKLELKEIHRFKNGFARTNGHDRWNITQLIKEILIGLEKVKTAGVADCTVGIDTWAVDYVLLDKEGKLLNEPVAYRDKRTDGAMEEVFNLVGKDNLYKKTGIQFLNFNSIFQFYREDEELLRKTADILMIPDYIAYCLTGKKIGEVSNVSTTQLLNIHKRDYDQELLDAIGLDRDKLPKLVETGTYLGSLLPKLKEKYDLPDCRVYAVATHDTASAVIGVPATSDNWSYLSSGTWSLIGVENKFPVVTDDSLKANYTNEWGAYQTYRFLKNITGMWIVQEIARQMDYKYTYAEMAEQAYKVEPFLQYINLNDERFTNPDNMIQEIQAYCRERGAVVPETVGELTMCVYSNLALAYAHEWKIIERLTGRKLDVLHIVGGGSNVALLNQLTADVIGKPVIAGPSEGTAIGNLLVQLIAAGQFKDAAEARKWLTSQIERKTYQPQPIGDRDHLVEYQSAVIGPITID